MQREFEQVAMYKVYYFEGDSHELKTALFETKSAAESFCRKMPDLDPTLNRWLWTVKVER